MTSERLMPEDAGFREHKDAVSKELTDAIFSLPSGWETEPWAWRVQLPAEDDELSYLATEDDAAEITTPELALLKFRVVEEACPHGRMAPHGYDPFTGPSCMGPSSRGANLDDVDDLLRGLGVSDETLRRVREETS